MIKKQIFKGKVLMKARVVNNILRVYNNSNFEFKGGWYIEASNFAKELAIKHDVSYLKVCGIISALSPLKTWNENKRIVVTFLNSGKTYHTKLATSKAETILNKSVTKDDILTTLRGNKIKSFFINIAYPTLNNVVTIDRHAISICLNKSIQSKEYIGITTIQYNFFVACYIEAGVIENKLASTIQSVTWEKWRELKKQTK